MVKFLSFVAVFLTCLVVIVALLLPVPKSDFDNSGFPRTITTGPKAQMGPQVDFSQIAQVVNPTSPAGCSTQVQYNQCGVFAATSNMTWCKCSTTLNVAHLTVTNAIPVSSGGTSLATLTSHAVLLGEGTGALHFASVAALAAGQPLVVNTGCTDPVFGIASVTGGGTGVCTLSNHALLIGHGTSAVTTVGPGTCGVPLIGKGCANPNFGTAKVAGGGTGAVCFTSHGVLLGHTTSAVTATAAGTAKNVLISNGACADPGFCKVCLGSSCAVKGIPANTRIWFSSGCVLTSSANLTFPNASNVTTQMNASTSCKAALQVRGAACQAHSIFNVACSAGTTIFSDISGTGQFRYCQHSGTGAPPVRASGVIFSSSASATVSGTTSATSVIGTGSGTLTLPANMLIVGKTIRITTRGVITTAVATPGTITVVTALGGTTVTTSGAISLNTLTSLTNAYWECEQDITCLTTGAGGTVIAEGKFTILNGLTPSTSGLTNTSAITINTTTTEAITQTFQFSSSTTNAATGETCVIQVLN